MAVVGEEALEGLVVHGRMARVLEGHSLHTFRDEVVVAEDGRVLAVHGHKASLGRASRTWNCTLR